MSQTTGVINVKKEGKAEQVLEQRAIRNAKQRVSKEGFFEMVTFEYKHE